MLQTKVNLRGEKKYFSSTNFLEIKQSLSSFSEFW